jgi:hypothetical protein
MVLQKEHNSKSIMVLQHVSIVYILLSVPAVLIVSGLCLFNLKNTLVALHAGSIFLKLLFFSLIFIHTVTSRKQEQAILETVRPYLKYLNKFAELIFGKASKFSFSFNHICLIAMLIILIGILEALKEKKRGAV